MLGAVLDSALLQPRAHIRNELGKLHREVRDNEPRNVSRRESRLDQESDADTT